MTAMGVLHLDVSPSPCKKRRALRGSAFQHFTGECAGGFSRRAAFREAGCDDAAMSFIFHVCRAEEWRAAQTAGAYAGSSRDAADGFIHFSSAAQAQASAAKHRAGQTDLVVLAVEASALGDALKWEPSRGGALFPHLYGPLPLAAVRGVAGAPLDDAGTPRLPPLDDPAAWPAWR